MAELEVGIGFNNDTAFSFNTVGNDFSISLSPENTQVLMKEITLFSAANADQLQKSMGK